MLQLLLSATCICNLKLFQSSEGNKGVVWGDRIYRIITSIADHILLELIPPDTSISNITHASFTSQIYLVFQKIINSVSFINVLKYELKT